MTRISELVLTLVIALSLAPGASFARHHARPNGFDTRKASAKAPHQKHATSGSALGTGDAKPPPAPSGNAAIDENATIDSKVKSICRGC